MRQGKVRGREGRDYLFRLRPYRTTDNKIDGAVIMLVDIDGKKRQTSNSQRMRENRCNARWSPRRPRSYSQ